jgi:uncharacterized membrane protein
MDHPVAVRGIRELDPNQIQLLMVRMGFLLVLFSVTDMLTSSYTAAEVPLFIEFLGLVIGFALMVLGMVLPRNPALLRRVNSVVCWLHWFYFELFVF